MILIYFNVFEPRYLVYERLLLILRRISVLKIRYIL